MEIEKKEQLLIKYHHGSLSPKENKFFERLRKGDPEFANAADFEDMLLRMRFQEKGEALFDSIKMLDEEKKSIKKKNWLTRIKFITIFLLTIGISWTLLSEYRNLKTKNKLLNKQLALEKETKEELFALDKTLQLNQLKERLKLEIANNPSTHQKEFTIKSIAVDSNYNFLIDAFPILFIESNDSINIVLTEVVRQLEILSDSSKNPTHDYILGQLYLLLNMTDNAVKIFSDTSKSSSLKMQKKTEFLLGFSYFLKGDFKEGEKIFLSLLYDPYVGNYAMALLINQGY